MTEKEVSKIFQNSKVLLIVSLTMLIVGLFIAVVGTKNINKDLEVKNYHNLIIYGSDKENDYVSININSLPYLVADETKGAKLKKYYIVLDENSYPYIVRISDKTYNKIASDYDKDKKVNYELKGYLFRQDYKLKKIVIESSKDILKDTNKVDYYNYASFYGSTYLDENLLPDGSDESVALYVGGALAILGLIFFIVYLVGVSNFKKTFRNYSTEDLKYELQKNNTLSYKKLKIYLTENYLISKYLGLNVLKYDEILWLYIENTQYGEYLIARTIEPFRIVRLTYTFNHDALVEIISIISDINRNILIGYDDENNDKYIKMIEKEEEKSK